MIAVFEELLAQNPKKKKNSACLTYILQCLTPVISPDGEPATHKKDKQYILLNLCHCPVINDGLTVKLQQPNWTDQRKTEQVC